MKTRLLLALFLYSGFIILGLQLKGQPTKKALKRKIVAPYIPLQMVGDTAINLLGRRIIINKDGFPKQIQTFYNDDNTNLKDEPNIVLYEGVHFHFTKKSDGKDIKLKNSAIRFTKQTPAEIDWQTTNESDSLKVEINASAEFDGQLHYTVKVIALQDLDFKDIVMHIPFQKNMATYFKGLGIKGGVRPEKVQSKWDNTNKDQDVAWIGNINAGLQFSLGDEKFVRPLDEKGNSQQALPIPASWNNENKGGIDVFVKGSSMLANSYSGSRSMKKGEALYYDFNLMITPTHLNDKPF